MSDLTFNKIAGAVLATGLLIVGLGELSNIVFTPEEPTKAGYAIEGVEEPTGGETVAVDTPPDWAAVLTPANIAAGKEIVDGKCASCHHFEDGAPVIQGPTLWGVVGRQPGAHAGMAYSDGMKTFGQANKQWDYDHLYVFLKAPSKDVPGTKMTFVGLKSPEDRIAVVAYLHSLGSSLPIPPPRPAAAAPAAAAPAAGAAPVTGAATPAGAPAATGAPTTPATPAPTEAKK